MLSNFLTTPVFNKPTPPDVNKRGDNLEAYEVKVPDTGEHSYIVRKIDSVYSTLFKLELNGVHEKNFCLQILVDCQPVTVYNVPYLLTSKVIDFYIPKVNVPIEIDVRGFKGSITIVTHHDDPVDTNLICQNSGRSMFGPHVTDLLINHDDPIESVVLNVAHYFAPNVADYNIIKIDYNTDDLDAMYHEFTGKIDRPNNFAVCTIKDKPMKFDRCLKLLSVLINGKETDMKKIHYNAHDVFTYCKERTMCKRYQN